MWKIAWCPHKFIFGAKEISDRSNSTQKIEEIVRLIPRCSWPVSIIKQKKTENSMYSSICIPLFSLVRYLSSLLTESWIVFDCFCFIMNSPINTLFDVRMQTNFSLSRSMCVVCLNNSRTQRAVAEWKDKQKSINKRSKLILLCLPKGFANRKNGHYYAFH